LAWNDSKQIEFSILNPRKSRLNPHKLLITHFWNVTVEKLVLFIDQHVFHLFDANVRQTGIAELQQIAHFLQLLWGKKPKQTNWKLKTTIARQGHLTLSLDVDGLGQLIAVAVRRLAARQSDIEQQQNTPNDRAADELSLNGRFHVLFRWFVFLLNVLSQLLGILNWFMQLSVVSINSIFVRSI
jgi:hypothetical protein